MKKINLYNDSLLIYWLTLMYILYTMYSDESVGRIEKKTAVMWFYVTAVAVANVALINRLPEIAIATTNLQFSIIL